MKTHKRTTTRALVAVLFTGVLLPFTPLQAASGDDTAAYYKAHAYDYENQRVDMDVAMLRAIPKGPETELNVRLVVAFTFDEDAKSSGGHIVCVVPEEDFDRLINRYGTNLERSGREPETKTLRGVLRILDNKRDFIYLDLTDKGEELNDAIKEIIRRESEQGRHNGPGKRHGSPL